MGGVYAQVPVHSLSTVSSVNTRVNSMCWQGISGNEFWLFFFDVPFIVSFIPGETNPG